jgi:hypothetical protein
MAKPTKDPGPIVFTATIEQGGDAREAAWVVFPRDLKEAYGIGNLVPVVATFDGVEYRGSIAKMGGQPLLLVRKDVRAKLGKAGGDTVDVTVTLDKSERKVEVPDDLQHALAGHQTAAANFKRMSYTTRREFASARARGSPACRRRSRC